MRRYIKAMLVITVASLLFSAAYGETSLTLADARARALEFNRQYLSAKQELVKSDAEVRKARSGVFPDVSISAGYSRNLKIPSFFIFSGDTTMELTTGSKNAFSASFGITQPIWEGGKVFQAWSIAKLYHKYTRAGLNQAASDIIYQTDLLFNGTTLARAQLDVLQKAYEANTRNLEVVEKQYGQGMVSEFELLRARVEKANLEPAILQAESEVRLAEKRLKSFLGMVLNEPVTLVEPTGDTVLAPLPSLETMVDTALANRPEMQRAGYLTGITRKAVTAAKSEYWPKLDAMTRYDIQSQSNDFDPGDNVSKSWTAGLALTIPFPWLGGDNIGGDVQYRKADYNQMRLAEQQTRDDIRLEVEQAFDQLMQAQQSLEVQRATIAQAEEGLKIANVRYQSGVGTQLEVLSAQAALTEARRSRAQAVFNFRQAKAGLTRATTIDIH